MTKIKAKALFSILYILSIHNSFGQMQPAKISFEMNAGVPIMFGSIPSSLSTYGGLGIRYSFTTALSAQFSFNIGAMRGSQDQTAPSFIYPEEVSNYKSYTSNFYNYALRGQLNLDPVFKLRSYKLFRRMNPYLIGGIGYTSPRGEGWVAERYYGASTKSYINGVKDVWTTQVGLVLRFYLNPLLDLNVGSEFNHCQTYYLDGIYPDKQYDHYLTNYIGVNIKIGASKHKQNTEWQNITVRQRRPKLPKKEDNQPIEPIVAETIPTNDSVETVTAIQTDTTKQDSVFVSTKPTVDTLLAKVDTTTKENTPASVVTTKPAVALAAKPIVKAKPTNKPIVKQSKIAPTKPESIKRTTAVSDKDAATLNMIEGVAAKTPAKYTVIGGAYSKSKIKYAYMFRDRLRKQGYPAAIVQSDIDPNIVRVMIYSTNDKKVAIQQCYKARNEIEKTTWINVAK